MKRRFPLSAALAFSLAAFFPACTRKADVPLNPLVETGKHIYLANCIACHNADPTKDGPVGPAVAGSSLDLVRARVMAAGYPPGYKPKRQSTAMAPLPQLKDQLEALHAFLNAP